MKKLIVIVLSLISTASFANEFFAAADLAKGKALVTQHCISCHASSYGGDGSEIYTRPFHKVESSKALLAQVRACSTNLDLQWFDDEEFNAAAYLNKTYYKFEQ